MNHNQLQNYPNFKPKWDFPEFDHVNPIFWIRQCETFFQMNQVPTYHYMDYVIYHLSKRVKTWLEGYVSNNRGEVQWIHFCKIVCKKFRSNMYP